MNGEQLYVSVVEPLGPAIERVKTVLFRPFDLGKWFVIGFCAWLAQLGSAGGNGGGSGGRGSGGGGGFRRGGFSFDDFLQEAREALAAARGFVEANLIWIVPLAILGLTIIVGLWLLFTWLSSRGRFMFLHCVVENKGEVVVPWHKFRQHGDSLFVFRIILGLIGFLIVAAGLLAASSFLIEAATRGDARTIIMTVVTVILGIFLISIPLLIVKKFTADFVVPIMFLQTTGCVTAWRQFLPVLSENRMRFLWYLLFQIVIGFVIGILIVATVCCTCCCAGCLFALPYVGTVAMLPILVFGRSYSLYYLRQYGPAFDVFRAEQQGGVPG
ncbi:MAG: DUF7544 domain-containing protein [Planctomycetota bacterium]|jgi:hypothetical protein